MKVKLRVHNLMENIWDMSMQIQNNQYSLEMHVLKKEQIPLVQREDLIGYRGKTMIIFLLIKE